MSFDPFGDFETAGYLRNVHRLKDSNLVKRLEHASFEANVEEALAFLQGLAVLDYASVLRVHRILFSSFYPWAGKDRNEVAPKLAVFKGGSDDPHATAFEHPASITRVIDYAFAQAAKPGYLKEHPGEVMGLLAFAHPFLDGNGRTILLVFMELCFRAGFAVDWSRTAKTDYLRTLSEEINDPDAGHLDAYLKPFVVDVAERRQWLSIIGGIEGLDGLDPEGLTYGSFDDPETRKRYEQATSSRLR